MYESPTELLKRIGELLQPLVFEGGLEQQSQLEMMEALARRRNELLDALHELLLARVRAQQELSETASRVLFPKDKELTELDRKTRLDASVAHIQHDVDLLSGLEELIWLRLTS